MEFNGIPESTLASGKFLQGVKGDNLGPFFFDGSELCQSTRKRQRYIKARDGRNGQQKGTNET